MRAMMKWTLVACLTVGLANAAQAQRPGGGFGFGGLGFLVQNEGVQKELKITDEQKDKLKDAMAKVRENHKDDVAKLQDRDTPREERQKLMQALAADNTKALAGVLDAKQLKRLKQIDVQTQGARAFGNPEVQKALKLTGEQKDKLKTIDEDSMKEMREVFQGDGSREEKTKKFAELRKTTMEKAAGVLTADQKKTWKELTGEPFTVVFQPRKKA